MISGLQVLGAVLVKFTLDLQRDLQRFSTYLMHSKRTLISGAITEVHQNDPSGPDRTELVRCPVPGTVAVPQDALTASMISVSETT